ncbi:MAG: chromosome segregation protein SMC [Oscillospiraceae bacterium]
MILKSIEIQGFKSFADKTVLLFGAGVTAVVGPNGSGKSNISDSVRWVLGEQSTKNLRGQSMEDVIFGGTATRKPHGFAEVTLTIDNTDRTLNFDDDFVAVTRRYYRSHESEYLINKAVVRLKDVHELFMDTGLGRDGYSMIGQGKIDSIVSSKSSERRDIFEEASGISRFRYRKEESERRLMQADDNLLRLRDIMDELEGRVGPLAEQSRKAEKFLEYSAAKKKLEIGLWLHSLEQSGEILRNQEHKITLAKAQYSEIEENLLNIAEKIEKTSESYTGSTAVIDNVRRQSSVLEENITRIKGEIAVVNNNIEHNNEAVLRIQNDILNLEQSDEENRQEVEDKRKTVELKTAELQTVSADIYDAEQELNHLISNSETVSREIEDLTRILNSISSASAEQRVQMVTAQSSLSEMESRSAVVEEMLGTKQRDAEIQEKEFSELNDYLQKNEETILECTNSLKGYELRYNSRAEKVGELKNKLDTTHLDVEEKKRRVHILEDLERNMEGYNFAVKAVMREAASGTVRGIHGPVSRIIEVAAEYATAIEIALGAAMQNIVVDNEGDAKRAIEYLKSNNKGRATFLPITSIKGRYFEEKASENTYGFIGIASDLVKCDKKYSEIIKSLLGRTIIAEDIDSAVAIAKKYSYRFKIVSLDGQVVNAGGSLTGGSISKNAGILSRAGDIANLKEQIEKLVLKSEQFKEQYASASAEQKAVEADIISAKSELTVANEDKIRLLGEIKRVGDLKATSEQAVKDFKAECESMEKRSISLNEIVNAALREISGFDEQKTKAQLKIDSASSGRDSASEKREELSAKITELKLKSMEIAKDIESLEASANLILASMGNRDDKTEELNNAVDALMEKNEALNSEISVQNEEISAKSEEILQLSNKINELIENRDNADKMSQELRRTEREMMSNREKLSGEVARLEERKETMLR